MNLVFKYILFCVIAILLNLLTQRMVLDLLVIENNYFIALLFGTLVSLFIKYYLDKKYIFSDNDSSIRNNSKKFFLYTTNGIFTTIIFWGTESFFFFLYGTTLARESGAIIGLSIGYILKYRLDKVYVFKKL